MNVIFYYYYFNVVFQLSVFSMENHFFDKVNRQLPSLDMRHQLGLVLGGGGERSKDFWDLRRYSTLLCIQSNSLFCWGTVLVITESKQAVETQKPMLGAWLSLSQ
jgi:hypothetical protein